MTVEGYQIRVEYEEDFAKEFDKFFVKMNEELIAEVQISKEVMLGDERRPVIAMYTIYRHMLKRAREAGAEINLE